MIHMKLVTHASFSSLQFILFYPTPPHLSSAQLMIPLHSNSSNKFFNFIFLPPFVLLSAPAGPPCFRSFSLAL